jgi:hypothetical protein
MPLSYGEGVRELVALADGRLASGGDVDGNIKLWLVDEQKMITALCLRAGRNLTKDEWAHYIDSDILWQESCRAFGVPSKWRTIDESKSGALALDNAPAQAQPAAPPTSSEPGLPSAGEKESPVSAPVSGASGGSGEPRVGGAPAAPKDPRPRPAQHSQHVARTALHGNLPTPPGNTTAQLNQQELARQKSVVSTPENSISGFFKSLFR